MFDPDLEESPHPLVAHHRFHFHRRQYLKVTCNHGILIDAYVSVPLSTSSKHRCASMTGEWSKGLKLSVSFLVELELDPKKHLPGLCLPSTSPSIVVKVSNLELLCQTGGGWFWGV